MVNPNTPKDFMSDESTQLVKPPNKLTNDCFQDWKRKCLNKALQFDAYEILIGTESEPTLSMQATPEERKAIRDYRSGRNKIAGYILDTLNAGQLTILASIEPTDPAGIWTALLAHFKSKDTNSHLFTMQQLILLCMGDPEHESKNFSKFGTQYVSAANILHNLLPIGAIITPAVPAANSTIQTP